MKRILFTIAAAALALLPCGCSPADFLDALPFRTAPAETLPSVQQLEEQYSGYGFRALQTEAEKQLYAKLDTALQSTEPKAFSTLPFDDAARISDVLEFYKDDHPDVFWIEETEPYLYSNTADGLELELRCKLSGSELSSAKEELEAAVQAAVADAPQGSDYEKEKYAHDYLMAHCVYDDEAVELHKSEQVRANEQNAYGALVEGEAVCEGYARAFQLLCQRMGVNCWVIQGQAEGFEENTELTNHIWNCVELDGAWYQVDVTWDDTEDEGVACERYLYFNLTTAEMTKDHTISPLYSEYSGDTVWYNGFVPQCDSTEYCYLQRNSVTIDSLDDSALPEYLAKTAARNEKNCVLLVGESLDFNDTFDQIVQSYAYDWITQANEENGYSPVLTEECTVTGLEMRRVIVLVLDYE